MTKSKKSRKRNRTAGTLSLPKGLADVAKNTKKDLDIQNDSPHKGFIDAKGAPKASTGVRAGGLNLESTPSLATVRAAFFVDGFNLYHGIHDCGKPHLKWLNLRALAEALKLPDEEIVGITWCTAIPPDTDKAARHGTYVRALMSVDVKVLRGHWANDWHTCRLACDKGQKEKEFYAVAEKEGDVNLALRAVIEAKDYDKCYLITGDSDQVPTINHLRNDLRKKVGVFFPPHRSSKHLRDLVRTAVQIHPHTIEKCRFPDEVHTGGKYPAIKCPKGYLLPKDWKPIPAPEKAALQKRAPLVEYKDQRRTYKS